MSFLKISKNIKQLLYYILIIILFVAFDETIYYLTNIKDSCTINETLKLENETLKKNLQDITNLDYKDYDYTIGKITYNNLYNSNAYFIETNTTINEGLVLNNLGVIGLYKNKKLIPTKDLNLSIQINNQVGTLSNNEIHIIKGNYKEKDKIYTSNLTSTTPNLLIGYIKEIKDNDIETIIIPEYLKIDTNYVVILK